MKKKKAVISSNLRFMYVMIFSFIFIMSLVAILRVQLYQYEETGKINFPVFFLLIFTAGAYLSFRKYYRLVNYVEDKDEYLLIKKAGREEKIYIKNIKYISCDQLGIIGLELMGKSTFGSNIYFLPLNLSFVEHTIFNDLKDRVYKAHTAIGVTQ